ncbi:hypothetical protein FGRMN_5680 [Fusarium graminum]|nr:hypothetical protein FGRMN_5680 [Fusarium graminum]
MKFLGLLNLAALASAVPTPTVQEAGKTLGKRAAITDAANIGYATENGAAASTETEPTAATTEGSSLGPSSGSESAASAATATEGSSPCSTSALGSSTSPTDIHSSTTPVSDNSGSHGVGNLIATILGLMVNEDKFNIL